MPGSRIRKTQAQISSGEDYSDLMDRLGPIDIGIVHEQSPWTTHNGLRFAVETLSGGLLTRIVPRLLTIYAGIVESVRVGQPRIER